MPTILMLRDAFGAGGTLLAKGSRPSVNTALATQLIGLGAASPVGDWYPPGGAPSGARRMVRQGKRVLSFTTLAGWTVTAPTGFTVTAVDGYGSRSGVPGRIRIQADGSQASNAACIIQSPPNLGLQLGSNMIGLWVKLASTSTWATPGIRLAISPTNALTWATDYDIAWNANQCRPGDNFLTFNAAAAKHPVGTFKNNGSFDLSAQTTQTVAIIVDGVTNGQTADIYVESLWSDFANLPRLILGFDGTGDNGANQSIKTYTAPLMQKYGFRGYIGFSSNANNGDGILSDWTNPVSGASQFADVDMLYRLGWDVFNHGINHAVMTGKSDGLLWMHYTNQRDWQRAHGWWRGSDWFMAPNALYDNNTRAKLAAMGCRFQRNAGHHPNNHWTPFGYDQIDNFGYHSLDFPIGGLTDAHYGKWKEIADICEDYGADLNFGWHEVIPGGTSDGLTPTNDWTKIYAGALELLLKDMRARVDDGRWKDATFSEIVDEHYAVA